MKLWNEMMNKHMVSIKKVNEVDHDDDDLTIEMADAFMELSTNQKKTEPSLLDDNYVLEKLLELQTENDRQIYDALDFVLKQYGIKNSTNIMIDTIMTAIKL